MKRKWVILPIETKAREMQSKSLLAYKLVEKGYGVIILKWSKNGYESILPKGIWFTNNLFEANYSRIKRIYEKGHKIFTLDEEGLLYINEKRYLRRIYHKNLELITKFLCYGKEQHEIVKKQFPEYGDKVVITGNPRINLLNERFQKLDEDQTLAIKNNYGKYILVVSNFTIANFYGSSNSFESRYSKIYRNLKDQKLINNEKEVDELNEHFRYLDRVFNEFIILVEYLSSEFPEFNIIVRPHPSESIENWKIIESKGKNIKVVYEGSLTEWIKSSTVVIQNNCTSAIESLFLTKPCISYRPIMNEKYDQPLTKKLSINLRNKNEVIEYIKNVIYNDESLFHDTYKVFKQSAEANISFSVEDESIEKIIQEIETVMIGSAKYNKYIFISRKLRSVRLIDGIKYLYRKLRTLACKTICSIFKNEEVKDKSEFCFFDKKSVDRLDWKSYDKHKFGDINEKDFNEMFDKLNYVYEKKYNYKVKTLENEIFMIYED